MSERDYRTPEEAQKLVELGRRVFRGHVGIEELDDGCALLYPADEAWGDGLAAFASHARLQHPWLDFEVEPVDAGGELRLSIRGSDNAARWIREALSVAASSERRRSRGHRRYRAATSALRVLPDFLIIGAPRSGTWTMYSILGQHPGVVPAWTKEIAYFNVHHGRGALWYRRHFPSRIRKLRTRLRTGVFATGEATPTYLFDPRVPKRVRQLVPGAKLIVLLRNPIDRAYSHYHWSVRMCFETLSFDEVIDREEDRLEGELEKMLGDEQYVSFPRGYLAYLSMGRYAEQIEAWLDVFPREQLLIISTGEFRRETADVVARTLRFLGLPEYRPHETRPVNTGQYPPMSASARERLRAYFRPHNERLHDLLGVEYGWDGS